MQNWASQFYLILYQPLCIINFIAFKNMKDKFSIFSPQASRAQHQQSSLNFKKSPNKFAFIDPYYKTKDNLKNHSNQTFTYSNLENVKKISNQYSQLRQTMSFKTGDFAHWMAEDQLKNNKNVPPSQSLRQTMDSSHPFRNREQHSHSYHSEHTIPISNEFSSKHQYSGGMTYSRKNNINVANENKAWQNQPNPKKEQQNYLQKYKSQIVLKKNFSQSQKLRAKNDKIIEQLNQLKKITCNTEQQQQKQSSFLSRKNSYNIGSNEKASQIGEEIRFRKNAKKQSEPMECFTPTIPKYSYEERFKQVGSPTSTNNSDSKSPPNKFIDIPDLKKKNNKVSLEDFNIIKTLGQGKFGTVMMVRHKKTNSIVALKKIPKSMIKSHLMIEQLALEIRIQTCLSHKNILGIYGCFDDATFLYIVLEFMQEGTLYSQLKKQGILPQKEAAEIILQITRAVNFLHDHEVAHRDIKPQNIVISNNVYKLCDFGWATICNQRRKTYCGTIDYTAPQILQGSEYDMTVDLWCLGVLTYELLVGKAPFYHLSRKETMKKILNVQNQSIVFPPNISQTARDFMEQLIKKNSGQRMKTADALKHPFLNNIQEQ